MTIVKTAVVHHPVYRQHDTGFGHPESPERHRVVMDALQNDSAFWNSLYSVEAGLADVAAIERCHRQGHFEFVKDAVERGAGMLDADTVISPHSLEAASRGAGGVCNAVDLIVRGDVSNAFVPVRPPGHHATPKRAMGFCLFNNIAIGARYAQNKYPEIEKVAIVDWDVHHGNGTQDIFYDDPTVFFFSMHQYPWYPGTGSEGETGIESGRGFTKNAAIRANMGAREQVEVFASAIETIGKSFSPDLIMISAGFDAHASDPLGQLSLEDEHYIEMTKLIKGWAADTCEGRIVSCLEGGYNLNTLGQTVKAHVSELAA
jgi:acetoin utilization deacetylase AcuC-like enzyme